MNTASNAGFPNCARNAGDTSAPMPSTMGKLKAGKASIGVPRRQSAAFVMPYARRTHEIPCGYGLAIPPYSKHIAATLAAAYVKRIVFSRRKSAGDGSGRR
jgi:hypothetical protein